MSGCLGFLTSVEYLNRDRKRGAVEFGRNLCRHCPTVSPPPDRPRARWCRSETTAPTTPARGIAAKATSSRQPGKNLRPHLSSASIRIATCDPRCGRWIRPHDQGVRLGRRSADRGRRAANHRHEHAGGRVGCCVAQGAGPQHPMLRDAGQPGAHRRPERLGGRFEERASRTDSRWISTEDTRCGRTDGDSSDQTPARLAMLESERPLSLAVQGTRAAERRCRNGLRPGLRQNRAVPRSDDLG